jgi:hypothetical protein
MIAVFRGPTITAAEVRAILPSASVYPPARHGDLLRLNPQPGDLVVIIDGVFHHTAAVRHKEILHLLATGVLVSGTASMGALRAAELHPYGMTGTGTVYEAYRNGTVIADEEVAVAHLPDEDYTPLSDAMIDITAVLAAAAAAGAVTAAEAAAIAGRARSMHYVQRSWAALRRIAGPAAVRADDWRRATGHPGAKLADARDTLAAVAAGTLPAAPPPRWTRQRWDNMYLRDWLGQYAGVTSGGVHIPVSLLIRYQQIYCSRFPDLWRRYVLAWIAGSSGPQHEDRALAAAASDGISAADLSPARARYWLTAGEMTLPAREQTTLILVRAVPGDLTAEIWPTSPAEAERILGPLDGIAAKVAVALRCNEQVAANGPGFATWLLRDDLITGHLARQWNIPGEGERLTAAARDRGFGSTADAADAARVFYLAAEGLAAVAG